MKLLIKTYIVRKIHTSIVSEINSKEEYNIIRFKNDNNNKIIILKRIKLITKKVSLLKN